MFQSFKKDRYVQLLLILIVLYIGYFSAYTILRHQTLSSSYYDLGIMDQTVYNTSRGRFLELTDPMGSNTIKRMAVHNDILLALLAPFYFLYKGPETLLVLQTVILVLGVIPLYLLTKKILNSKLLAIIFAFSYLMYPPLQRSNVFDFHAVTLSTSLLLWMFYLWTEKKYRLSFVFFILSILSKEQVGLTTGLFGMFVLLQSLKGPTLFLKGSDPDRKELLFGAIVFICSILWFISSFWVIIPHFRQANHFAVTRYKEFGDSPSAIVKGFFTHPLISASHVLSYETANYLFLILSPLLFLSIFSPLHLLIALPDLLINILSNEPNMKNIVHQYTAVITPFIFIAAVYGTKKLCEKYQRVTQKTVAMGLIIATLYMSFLKSPLPYSIEKNMAPFTDHPTIAYDVALWQRIVSDENIKISATDSIAAQFAERKTIMRFSSYYPRADYVIISRPQIFNDWLNWYNMPNIYTDLKNDVRFKIIYKRDTFEVYKKV